MRIITGQYKGRHFEVPRSFKARPTTDFAKENLFNVLRAYVDFEETRALDLFGGTGSISLELLSRGCRQVVTVERDRQHAAFIRSCLRRWTILQPHCSAAMHCVLLNVAANRLTWSLPTLPTRSRNWANCPTG